MNAIGIDIGGTSIKFALLDEAGKILCRERRPTPLNDPAALADIAAGVIYGWKGSEMPIGVACAGDVNNDTGLVTADNLGWDKVPLGPLLFQRLGRSVVLEQDAQAAMLAEWSAGSLMGEKNALYLTLGTGVGGGAIVGGKPHRELARTSSEYGHMITHAGGEPCSCGERGCYERYASVSALVRRAEGFSSAEEILAAVQAGNEKVVAIWKEYIREVCMGLVSLLNIFGPEVISIGGGISEAGDILLDSLKAGMGEHTTYTRYYSHTELRLAVFGNDAGVLGAAASARRFREK